MGTEKTLGQVAFEAYCASHGEKLGPNVFLSWDELRPEAREAWEAAAQSVLKASQSSERTEGWVVLYHSSEFPNASGFKWDICSTVYRTTVQALTQLGQMVDAGLADRGKVVMVFLLQENE